jgi:GNAT superfamily N-acetyltransferase
MHEASTRRSAYSGGVVEIRRYAHAELPPALRWQAVAFMRAEWPELDGPVLRDEALVGEHAPEHVVAVDGDWLVSHAAVVRARVEHSGATFDVRGLSGVFTFPAWRRQGYGGSVATAATDLVRASGADVGITLTGNDLAAFYARAGWTPLPGAVTLIGPPGAARPIPALRTMLFLSAKGVAARRAFADAPLRLDRGW